MFPLKSLTRQKEHRLLFRQAFGCIFTEKQKRGGDGQARTRLSHNTVEAVGHRGCSPAPQHTGGQGTGCHSPVLHLQLKQMYKLSTMPRSGARALALTQRWHCHCLAKLACGDEKG